MSVFNRNLCLANAGHPNEHLSRMNGKMADAKTPETLNTSYNQIAELLGLAKYDAQEQDSIIEAVKTYLQKRIKWLLILDDVDGDRYNAHKQHYLAAFLPKGSYGHILVTTQAGSLSHLGQGF